ncbi:MAG: MarR family transcriptional regulator, partial [Actinobacteria bacterium]|nr:MarR family transcriptional regulator [Actinomycetota bacterium]
MAVTVMPAGASGAAAAARPRLIRALNEQLLLGHIRELSQCSRADLARLSGLSKPTVSVALGNLERAGLVRTAGQRMGRPGRSALLYEIRPEAGFVLGLDLGARYVRGALADLAGGVRARAEARSRAASGRGRAEELIGLAHDLCAQARLAPAEVIQTVIGSP